jgi:hypothetical protein
MFNPSCRKRPRRGDSFTGVQDIRRKQPLECGPSAENGSNAASADCASATDANSGKVQIGNDSGDLPLYSLASAITLV